jgi:hypothetical protein
MEEKTLYELKKSDGDYISVWSKPMVDAQMTKVKLGQIVGFEFVGIGKPQPGRNPAKIITVYANPKAVDEQWMAENKGLLEELESPVGHEEPVDITKPPFESAPQPAATPQTTGAPTAKEQMLIEINNLVAIKFPGGVPTEEIPAKIMEATGLAFIELNLPAIIEKLKGMPNVF